MSTSTTITVPFYESEQWALNVCIGVLNIAVEYILDSKHSEY